MVLYLKETPYLTELKKQNNIFYISSYNIIDLLLYTTCKMYNYVRYY